MTELRLLLSLMSVPRIRTYPSNCSDFSNVVKDRESKQNQQIFWCPALERFQSIHRKIWLNVLTENCWMNENFWLNHFKYFVGRIQSLSKGERTVHSSQTQQGCFKGLPSPLPCGCWRGSEAWLHLQCMGAESGRGATPEAHDLRSWASFIGQVYGFLFLSSIR